MKLSIPLLAYKLLSPPPSMRNPVLLTRFCLSTVSFPHAAAAVDLYKVNFQRYTQEFAVTWSVVLTGNGSASNTVTLATLASQ
jgi:hypothetical protein